MTASNPSQTPRDLALSCIVYLQYAMAGDLDSTPHITELFRRWQQIGWNDPDFIAFSEQVRGGPLKAPLENDATVEIKRQAYQNFLIQQSAEVKESYETLFAWSSRITKYNGELASYICQFVAIHTELLSHLKSIGAEIEPYELPEFPTPPKAS